MLGRWICVGFVSLALLGCGGGGAGDTPDAGADAGTTLDEFFSLTVHEIEIDVGDTGYQSLLDQPRVYVPGSISIDGTSFASVGVRLKGGAGSFVPLDGDRAVVSGDGNGKPGKSAFIIDFNRYASGQSFHGLEKLTINNLVQDPSGIHEYVGYELFREGDVPAPRSSYATITLNDEDKGIYALIESPDNDEFLSAWFGTSRGNLYEGAYGTDLYGDRLEGFDQDNGSDTSKQDLRDLVAALDAIGDTEDPLPVLREQFDLDEYLTFAATELFLGHWDGYAWSSNNYFVHYDPFDETWSFLPWGIDQTFAAPLGEFSGVMARPGPSWHEFGGRVHSLCMRSASCRSLLYDAFDDLLARVDSIELDSTAANARDLIEDLVLDEATEFGDPSLTRESLDGTELYIAQRGGRVRAWLPCLQGTSIDSDSDGYDDCTVDCAPDNADVHPGATEQCNFVDDDCNGVLDDPAGCPRCKDELAPDGNTYTLCLEEKTWLDARQYCQDNGQDLASLHDEATAEHIAFALLELAGIESSWIGLNDRAAEGTWEWSDGTSVDYLRWIEEAPFGDGDCGMSFPFGWLDASCDALAAFVCK